MAKKLHRRPDGSVELSHISLASFQDFIEYLKSKIHPLVNEKSVVLDAGCGSTNYLLSQHTVKCLIGCDVDKEAVRRNNDISHGVLADIETQVFLDTKFDLVLSYNVIEHLEHPENFVMQVSNIIKDQGYIFIVIPHKHSLFGLLAWLTPYRMKKVFLKVLATETKNTHHWYKLNTPATLVSTLQAYGFDNIQITLLNTLPTTSGPKKAFFLYYQLCKTPVFRSISGGLLCVAMKIGQ